MCEDSILTIDMNDRLSWLKPGPDTGVFIVDGKPVDADGEPLEAEPRTSILETKNNPWKRLRFDEEIEPLTRDDIDVVKNEDGTYCVYPQVTVYHLS